MKWSSAKCKDAYDLMVGHATGPGESKKGQLRTGTLPRPKLLQRPEFRLELRLDQSYFFKLAALYPKFPLRGHPDQPLFSSPLSDPPQPFLTLHYHVRLSFSLTVTLAEG